MRRSKNPQRELGAAFRELRAERGSTQRTVAGEAGITYQHYCEVEKGHSNPTWGTVTVIAEALGVSVAELAIRAEAR